MSEWKPVRIGELGRVVTGKTPPSSLPELFNGSIPFITPSDMSDDARHIAACRHVSEDWDLKKRSLLPVNAICVVCIGATIGKTCMTKQASQTNQQINSVVVDCSVFDPHFIYYSIRMKADELKARAAGAATPIINKSAFSNVEIDCPGLETQRWIARILEAYDDLIEVNRQRVAVLEDMARGLFEEWFVRFRFPKYELLPLDDHPNGALPEGWCWGTASDVIEFDPKTKLPKVGRKPFLSMGHLDTATSLIDEPEMRDGNSGAKFREGDTLFARITPCLENGKTGLVRGLSEVGGVGFGSTEFIVMRGGRAGPAFTYCLARTSGFRSSAQQSMSGASGRQRAKTESVASFPLALPADDDLFAAFERAAWPLLELVGKLGAANQRLAAARDLLLPRLMSGQLSVSEAEVEAEAQKELEVA